MKIIFLKILINMLYSFNKYNRNLLNKIIKKVEKNQILIYSVFHRKNYFRSLICYLNMFYSNYLYNCEFNFFYEWRFLSTCFGNNHPSFYFRKIMLK